LTGAEEPAVGWLVSCHVAREKLEPVEALLERFGAQYVTCAASGDSGPYFERDPGAEPDWARLRVQAAFPPGLDFALLRAALLNLAGSEPALELLPQRDWVRENRASFIPLHAGGELWICPSWHAPPVPGAVNVILDPGAAFGTGRHPSTALCLSWLAKHPPRGARVIDFGCGSGILAIAALKLGAREASGVEIDPLARETAEENARRNGVAARFVVQPPDRGVAAGELVLANILADTLIELADHLASLTTAGGRILLSGILESQSRSVMAAYAEAFAVRQRVLDGWCLLIGERR
jgi:ribosomal protein L11 methyltransferase